MQEDVTATTVLASDGIVADQVMKTYKSGKIKALNGLTLHIKQGEAFGLIGPNGAGKTTFFGCLLAFLRVDSGRITFGGEATDSFKTRRMVGYLPERLTFDRWMTGREFMYYHHELSERPLSTRVAECEELLIRVALQRQGWDLPIKKYSRGMLQRLGLASALINDPRYLLLDEPASGVDPAGVLLVRGILRELKAKGVTILLNSHQLDQVEKVCDRVAFINAGQVQAIENLQADEGAVRHLVIKWKSGYEPPSKSELTAILTAQGAELLGLESDAVTVLVPNEDAIFLTIRALIQDSVPIIHAACLDGRLEKFFQTDNDIHGVSQ